MQRTETYILFAVTLLFHLLSIPSVLLFLSFCPFILPFMLSHHSVLSLSSVLTLHLAFSILRRLVIRRLVTCRFVGAGSHTFVDSQTYKFEGSYSQTVRRLSYLEIEFSRHSALARISAQQERLLGTTGLQEAINYMALIPIRDPHYV
jgi:hypothetical protein